jgi:hypothetical protein
MDAVARLVKSVLHRLLVDGIKYARKFASCSAVPLCCRALC